MSKRAEMMKNLHQMTQEQLIEHVYDLRKQLFALRLSTSTEHVKDYSQFKKLRQGVARAETLVRQLSNKDQ
jgi:ribosomal protein L29